MAAVAHGAGNDHTASWSGAPQVMCRRCLQLFWARGSPSSAGWRMMDRATVDSLSEALATALKPEMGVTAEAVAGRFCTDGAIVAASVL